MVRGMVAAICPCSNLGLNLRVRLEWGNHLKTHRLESEVWRFGVWWDLNPWFLQRFHPNSMGIQTNHFKGGFLAISYVGKTTWPATAKPLTSGSKRLIKVCARLTMVKLVGLCKTYYGQAGSRTRF